MNGEWRIAGDQRIGDIGVRDYADSRPLASLYNPGIRTGLAFLVERGTLSPTWHYAVVTGPGLPTTTGGRDGVSAGVLLVAYGGNQMELAQGAYLGPSTPRLVVNGGRRLPLTDAVVNLIPDNATYTLRVYADPSGTPGNFADDTLLATYTEVVGKRPYKPIELTAASFSTVLTTPAQFNNFAMFGGSLTVNWTLPSGLKTNYFELTRSGNNTEEQIWLFPAPIAISHTFSWQGPSFSVSSYRFQVGAIDVFKRELSSHITSY